MSSKDTRSDQVRRFVAAMYEPTDLLEIRLIPNRVDAPAEVTAPTRPTVQSRWFRAHELTGPTALAWMKAANDRGFGVYVGANPRKPKGKTAAGVALARSLFVDFDHAPDPAAPLARIQTAGLPTPTAVVASGHGIHAYWRLEEPTTDFARWTRAQKALIAALGSDKAIHDPSRVMRVPGFTNHKPPPAPCELVGADASLRYAQDAFATLHRPGPPPHPPTTRPGARPTTIDHARLSAKTAHFLAHGAKEGTRNARLYAAATELAGCKVDRSDAERVLLDAAVRSGLSEGESAETIASAFGRPRTPTLPQPDAPEWTVPLPLSRSGNTLQFPIDRAFPPALAPIRGFVEGIAEALQVPVDLPAMLVVPMATVAIAGKAEIRVREGWTEPPAIWTLTIMEPAERKSSAFAQCVAPLLAWQRDEAARLAPDIARETERRKTLESQRDKARNSVKPGKATAGFESVVLDLTRQIGEIEIPTAPMIVLSDATAEAIAWTLSKNSERAIIASCEGDALEVLMGRYSDRGAPNFGILLKAHAGDSESIVRRGHDPIQLTRPALSMALAVQAQAIRGTFTNRDALGRGFLARFLCSAPESRIGSRKVGGAALPLNSALQSEYGHTLRRLLNLAIDRERGPTSIHLSDEAARMFCEFEAAIERALGPDGELADRKEWGGKLCGAIARLALVFHCWERWGIRGEAPGESQRWTVNAETMNAALAWAPYLVAHYADVHELARSDPAETAAGRVLNWVKRDGVARFTKRDAFMACRGALIVKAEDLDDPLQLLERLGYVQPESAANGAPRPGRPASQRYLVNPLFLNPGAKS